MRQPHDRHLGQSEQPCSFYPSMPSDDLVVLINRDEAIESELFQRCGYLPDLFFRMGSGVALGRSKLLDLCVFDLRQLWLRGRVHGGLRKQQVQMHLFSTSRQRVSAEVSGAQILVGLHVCLGKQTSALFKLK